jgi:hypothetical protein
MGVLYIIMVVVFVSYISFIWMNYGVLESVSSSWYKLSINRKPLFTVYCWGFMIPGLAIGLEISTGSPYQFLMFLAGSGIMFVGAAPNYAFGLPRKVHNTGAFIRIASAYLFMLIEFTYLWPVTLAFLVPILILLPTSKFVKNRIWWIELLAFTNMSTVFGLHLYNNPSLL